VKKLFIVACLVVSFLVIRTPAHAQQNGTTLSADKTATGHLTRTFHWTIDKSVSPDNWDLFSGDSGSSNYTINVTKDSGTDTTNVTGEICVTNGGAVPTENLAISDEVQYKHGSGQFQPLTTSSVDLGSKPVLGPSESNCYPYSIDITPEAGAEYRNVAHVTITNHGGWIPGGQNCPGPSLCPFGPDPKADFSIPTSPDQFVNDTINVDDTNGGSWAFNASGSQTYDKTFTCDADAGTLNNTATIRETGQSDSASVTVNCYGPTVTKNANTSLTRTYNWDIVKSADQTNLTLAKNETYDVHYTITPSATFTDSNWATGGTITVHNPAPIPATLNSVSDIVTGPITGNLNCPVTFPYTLAAGADLVCTYTAALPDDTTRTNTATATQQNYSYDKNLNATANGTTDYSGTAPVDFSGATIDEIDTCISVIDSLQGSLGSRCYSAIASPTPFTYTRTIGPYTTCGNHTVTNTATSTTNNTNTTDTSSWTVNANVPCPIGCTLTIGYWKNHAGFGPQRDVVSSLLPKCLGNGVFGICLPFTKGRNVSTAQDAVNYLSMKIYGAPSNGITKLYAQLLGAKLNIAAGASNTISSTIIAADSFLTVKNYLDWSGLSKPQQSQVLSWMSALDNYNNGLGGVPHCSQ
jgi:hypothetical protein